MNGSQGREITFEIMQSQDSQQGTQHSGSFSVSYEQNQSQCSTKQCYSHLVESLQNQLGGLNEQAKDYKQGILTFLSEIDSQSLNPILQRQPKLFSQMVKRLEKQDFSSMHSVWNRQFIQEIIFILTNWKELAPEHKEILDKYLNVLEKNVNCELIDLIYRGAHKQISSIEKQLGRSIKANVMGESLENPSNFFFKKYQNELVLKANKEGSLFLIGPNQSKKALGQHIGQNNIFEQNRPAWQLFFFVAFCHLRCKLEATKFEDIQKQIESIYRFAELTIKGNELTQPCNRLCCARFFYLNFDISPLQNINVLYRKKLEKLKPYLPVKKEKGKESNENKKKQIEEKPAIQQPQKNELEETMLDICALLNSGGGVVLFNVEPEYLQLRPYGQSLIKSEMDQYKLLILQGLKKITPQVQHGSQIIVSYVPLAKHPYQYGYIDQVHSDQERKANRIYIDGLYVLRISVAPSSKEHLYCYTTSKGQTKSATFEDGKRRDLLGEQIAYHMKLKFQFFEVEDADEQLAELLGKDFTHVDKGHRCVQPYIGNLVHKRQQPKIYDDPESKFKCISLMVASNNSYNESIKKILISKGIQNQIYAGFQKYKLKAAMNSVPIFHNCRFDQLLTEVAYRPEFKFGDRPTLVIKVTEFLKFVNRRGEDYLNRTDFDTLQKWLQKEFPHQSLEYWTYTDDDNITEHYLRSGSRLSLIFIYYVMYQFNEKSMFKDPKTTRSLSDEEKKQKMKLIYASKKPGT